MSYIRINMLYGIVALIPIALVGLVLYYVYGFWTLILVPASDELGLTTNQSRLLGIAVAIPAFLILCFFVGFLIRTRLGTLSFDWLESRFLSQIPGYGIIANLLRGFAERESRYPAALLRLSPDGPLLPGFIMEDDGGPQLTVFVPLAPVMTMGTIYIVERDKVEVLQDATVDLANRISQWGTGLQDMIARTKKVQAEDTTVMELQQQKSASKKSTTP